MGNSDSLALLVIKHDLIFEVSYAPGGFYYNAHYNIASCNYNQL